MGIHFGPWPEVSQEKLKTAKHNAIEGKEP
jgi:hypothetical protein